MRHLHLCELVLDEPTDNSVTFLCIGLPTRDDLLVMGCVASRIAFGIQPPDGGYDRILESVDPERTVVRSARCPRQMLSDSVISGSLVFDVERVRDGDMSHRNGMGDVN